MLISRDRVSLRCSRFKMTANVQNHSYLEPRCWHIPSLRHRELRALPNTTLSPIISFLMEFWGIEVKPGQTVKCEPGDERILHLSQASLGETKEKGTENVPIFVKVKNQKLVIGTLVKEKCAQIQYDLVFEKEFDLSHGSKSTSVYFVGYRSSYQGYESEDDLYDTTSEDELEINEKANGKPSKKELLKSATEKAAAGKDNSETEKLKAKTEKPNKDLVKADEKVEDKDDDGDSDDEDDSEEDSDEDEDMVEPAGGSSDEDEDQSSEEEATPEKVESCKKRKADSAAKTPIRDKKAKVVAPAGNKKTDGDGKKGGHVHVATPHPAKQGGKPQPSPKSGGSVICKSCSRTFNSENALQAHSKAKHGAK